jgi:preprotein translocase subunit SecE
MLVAMAGKRYLFDGDGLKWVLALSVVGLGVWTSLTYVADSLLYRLLVILGACVVGIGVISQTEQVQGFWALLREARLEIRKVVWPTHQETVQTLLLILLFVLFMAIVLWLLDSGLGWIAAGLIG